MTISSGEGAAFTVKRSQAPGDPPPNPGPDVNAQQEPEPSATVDGSSKPTSATTERVMVTPKMIVSTIESAVLFAAPFLVRMLGRKVAMDKGWAARLRYSESEREALEAQASAAVPIVERWLGDRSENAALAMFGLTVAAVTYGKLKDEATQAAEVVHASAQKTPPP